MRIMRKKSLNQKKGCRAALVIGDFLAKTWALCDIRFRHTCCKDCEYLIECQSPCSMLYPYYLHKTKTYDFENFRCMYFITEVEALFKRLSIDQDRGIRE